MRRILITGGTGVIGRSLIEGLISDGHYVYFTSRSEEKGRQLIKELGLDSDMVSVIQAEFSSKKELEKIVGIVKGSIDSIIFNARNIDNILVGEEGTISKDQFQDELFMAVTFPYLLSTELVKDKANLRDLIFISSMYGVVSPTPSLYDNFKQQSAVNYGVAKAAQIHLVKELSVRFSDDNIRCNCISYGGVEGRANDEFKKRYNALNPMARMLQSKDLYPPVKYILDNRDLPMTGENLKIDGGWTVW